MGFYTNLWFYAWDRLDSPAFSLFWTWLLFLGAYFCILVSSQQFNRTAVLLLSASDVLLTDVIQLLLAYTMMLREVSTSK